MAASLAFENLNLPDGHSVIIVMLHMSLNRTEQGSLIRTREQTAAKQQVCSKKRCIFPAQRAMMTVTPVVHHWKSGTVCKGCLFLCQSLRPGGFGL